MGKPRPRARARAPRRAAFEIVDTRGSRVTVLDRLEDCRRQIAEFFGLSGEELKHFKTKTRPDLWGRTTFEAYERDGRVFEVIQARKTVERRPGRPRRPSPERNDSIQPERNTDKHE